NFECLGYRLGGTLPVADRAEDECRGRELRAHRLRVSLRIGAVDRLYGVALGAYIVSPRYAYQRAERIHPAGLVDAHALLDVRNGLLRVEKRVLPLAPVIAIRDRGTGLDEAHVGRLAVVVPQSYRLRLPLADRPRPAVERVQRSQVVPSPEELL